MAPRRIRQRPEEALHMAVARFLDVALPSDALWWHTPNGGKRSKVEAGKFKAMGVRAGFHDIAILWNGIFRTIELKPRGRHLSPDQRDMGARIVAAGADWDICRSLDDLVATMDFWGIPLRATVFGKGVATSAGSRRAA